MDVTHYIYTEANKILKRFSNNYQCYKLKKQTDALNNAIIKVFSEEERTQIYKALKSTKHNEIKPRILNQAKEIKAYIENLHDQSIQQPYWYEKQYPLLLSGLALIIMGVAFVVFIPEIANSISSFTYRGGRKINLLYYIGWLSIAGGTFASVKGTYLLWQEYNSNKKHRFFYK